MTGQLPSTCVAHTPLPEAAEALLSLYARDPWMLDLPTDIEALTPQNAAWIDAGLCLFESSTLPHSERLGAVLLLTENARFVARQQRSEGQPADDLDRLLSSLIGDCPRVARTIPAPRGRGWASSGLTVDRRQSGACAR